MESRTQEDDLKQEGGLEDAIYPADAYDTWGEDDDRPGVNEPVPMGREGRRRVLDALDNKQRSPKQAARAQRRLVRENTKLMRHEKTRQALEMRKAGITYDMIAQRLDYADGSGAKKAVDRALSKVAQEPAVDLKVIQVERLNYMLTRLWPKVIQGDERAINTSLSVMDKLDGIVGTLAPAAVDVNVSHSGAVMVIDGNEEDFIIGMKRMAGIVAQDGQNHGAQAALPAAPPQVKFPPGMGETSRTVGLPDQEDIVEAELVEDEPEEVIPAAPTKKKFNFGVDPTGVKK